jgi:hypothetical protein
MMTPARLARLRARRGQLQDDTSPFAKTCHFYFIIEEIYRIPAMNVILLFAFD